MKLKQLVIMNFRCCKNISIDFGSMHALVGANNAGKSTILHALDLLFNPSTPKLSEESFWGKDTKLEIRIEGLFVELDEHERSAFDGYMKPDGSFHLARTVVWTNDEGESKPVISQQYNKPVPKHPWLRPDEIKTPAIKEWLKSPAALVANNNSFFEFLQGEKTVAAWKSAAKSFEQKLAPDDFEVAWIDNPQGYASVLKSNLPHFELIPAVRHVGDESKVLKTNPFGRLIHAIVNTLEKEIKDDIGTKLKATTEKLNRSPQRLKGIVEIETALNDYLADLMPADLEIEFQAPTIETLLMTPLINVDDGFKGSVDGKGHGLQRAVIFSILRSYAKLITTKKLQGRRTLFLGIEEPELYMHPTALRMIRRMFRSIADGGDQVIYCTHNPMLVDVAYFDEIIRVEPAVKADGNGAKIYQVTMASMIEDLECRVPPLKGKVTSASMRERYGHAYNPTRNEGFFAKKVILVEGQTESYCLPIYGEAMKTEFNANGIAVIECGGKNQIDRLYQVFNELGIPTYVLFDYDKSNKKDAVKASRELLIFLEYSQDAPMKPIVTEYFACFVEKWESDLQSEIPNHASLHEEATRVLGDCGKPLLARFVATKITSGEKPFVPPTLQSIIEKAAQVIRKGSCLKKAEPPVKVPPKPKLKVAEVKIEELTN
jgi:putative ATP-dependent endonuclease of the OLD family